MFNARFFVAWIFGALVMYSAFYLWHGVLSTDFYRIQYPKGIFLGLAAIVYLIISFVLYKLFDLNFWKKITKNLFLRGLMVGILLGFTLFAFSLVLGVSFSGSYSPKMMLIDLVWQIIEQCVGGMIVALSYMFIFAHDMDAEEIHNS